MLEDISKIVTIVFQLFSTVAIVGAAVKYLWGRDQRSGETLLHLENRFKDLQSRWQAKPDGEVLSSITRVIDHEAHEFKKSDLESAIDKGFHPERPERTPDEKAWMSRLDELLRFLLLVAAMEKNKLLKKRALWDAYHYWFCAVVRNPELKKYVGLYFPVLHTFLEENKEEINAYEFRGRAIAESVKAQLVAGHDGGEHVAQK